MSISYFLGANSSRGFYSLYDELRDGGSCYLHIIKGGAGCGKSTFMRKIADALTREGQEAEFVRCSGDINSVDAVYFPHLRTAFVDGTAPHIMEPRLFGVDGDYINLGQFSSTPFSTEDRNRLRHISEEYRRLYGYAYALIASAGELSPKRDEKAQLSEEIRAQAGEIVQKISSNKGRNGHIKSRYITAICHKGLITDASCIDRLDTLYAVDSTRGTTSAALEYFAKEFARRGYEVIKCLSPLELSCEAVLVNELNAGFISSDIKTEKCVKLIEDGYAPYAAKEGEAKHCTDALLSQACTILSDAGEKHSLMEQICGRYISFRDIDKFTDEFIEKQEENIKNLNKILENTERK